MYKVDVTKQASRSNNVHFSLKWAKHVGPRSTLAFMNMEYEGISAQLSKNIGRRRCRTNQPSFVVSTFTMQHKSDWTKLNHLFSHPLHPFLLTLKLSHPTQRSKIMRPKQVQGTMWSASLGGALLHSPRKVAQILAVCCMFSFSAAVQPRVEQDGAEAEDWAQSPGSRSFRPALLTFGLISCELFVMWFLFIFLQKTQRFYAWRMWLNRHFKNKIKNSPWIQTLTIYVANKSSMCASILLFSWHHAHSYLQIVFFAVCPLILLWSSLTYSIYGLDEGTGLDPGPWLQGWAVFHPGLFYAFSPMA